MLYSLKKFGFLNKNTIRTLTTVNSTVNTSRVLTPGCAEFIETVHQKLKNDHKKCLHLREEIRENRKYGFREDTKDIVLVIGNTASPYEGNEKLLNRHVEITGPANNKRMVINAFNSGANGYMTDLEDSMTPLMGKCYCRT